MSAYELWPLILFGIVVVLILLGPKRGQ